MSELSLAMPTILLQEGRKSNNKNDPGGYTDYGVSLRFLMQTGDLDKDGWKDGDVNHDGMINAADIDALSPEKAEYFYNLYWWQRYSYGLIKDQSIATKLLSLSLNMGDVGAHKCLQRAIRSAMGFQNGLILIDDGVLGGKTFAAVDATDPRLLLPALKSEAAGYYRSIRFKDPNKDAREFLNGWLNRAYSDMILKLPSR